MAMKVAAPDGVKVRDGCGSSSGSGAARRARESSAAAAGLTP
jgi:hypothetical protein